MERVLTTINWSDSDASFRCGDEKPCHLATVKALIDGGADVGADDGWGGNAISNAKEHPEIQNFLRGRLEVVKPSAREPDSLPLSPPPLSPHQSQRYDKAMLFVLLFGMGGLFLVGVVIWCFGDVVRVVGWFRELFN